MRAARGQNVSYEAITRGHHRPKRLEQAKVHAPPPGCVASWVVSVLRMHLGNKCI
jgi:hypothetical protein